MTTVAAILVCIVLLQFCWEAQSFVSASTTPVITPSPIVQVQASHEQDGRNSGDEVTVLYGNNLQTLVHVEPGETLLAAMERVPELQSYIPHDCRKGTCFTCAASVVCDPSRTLSTDETGLSPSLSLAAEGYILPCSTTTTKGTDNDDDVVVRLDAHHDVWERMYQDRLGQDPDRSSSARVMRKYAERNVHSWIQQTEETFRTPDDDDRETTRGME